MRKQKAALVLALLLVPVLLAACEDEGPAYSVAQPSHTAATVTTAATAAPGSREYVLGIGDKLHITVFNEPNLSGDFQVASTGMISMPLIGEVRAAGASTAQLQAGIARKLSDGYMKDPSVSIEVSNYRPFFIVGEVMKPGSYTYENGLTVIGAVALAGGYTYRADKDDIKLRHGESGGEEAVAPETAQIMPGDIITVPERFF